MTLRFVGRIPQPLESDTRVITTRMNCNYEQTDRNHTFSIVVCLNYIDLFFLFCKTMLLQLHENSIRLFELVFSTIPISTTDRYAFASSNWCSREDVFTHHKHSEWSVLYHSNTPYPPVPPRRRALSGSHNILQLHDPVPHLSSIEKNLVT